MTLKPLETNFAVEIVNGIWEDATFLELYGNTCVTEKRKYVTDKFDVLFPSFREYYDIVEIPECELPRSREEDHVPCALERAWGIS